VGRPELGLRGFLGAAGFGAAGFSAGLAAAFVRRGALGAGALAGVSTWAASRSGAGRELNHTGVTSVEWSST